MMIHNPSIICMLFAFAYRGVRCVKKRSFNSNNQFQTHHMGNVSMMDRYHILDDGRVVELTVGKPSNSDDAIWARNLTAGEKETFLKLKGLGLSDMDIYLHLNPEMT